MNNKDTRLIIEHDRFNDESHVYLIEFPLDERMDIQAELDRCYNMECPFDRDKIKVIKEIKNVFEVCYA